MTQTTLEPRGDVARRSATFAARPIVVGGLSAGVLDIVAAVALTLSLGGSGGRMLQGIASGVMGAAAFQGGARTAALGLALHFVIAFGAAAVYTGASRLLPVLVRRPVVSGLAYGVAVYLFMNRLVVPLSRVTVRASPWHIVLTLVVIHMLFVGLPIALAARRSAARR